MIRESNEEGKVVRVCDMCGNERLITRHTLYVNRQFRNRNRDLCISCGNKESCRVSPQPVGDKSPQWRGGLNNGYQMVYWRDSSGKACKDREHRIVLRQALGRPLSSTEKVHHVDMVKTNNRIKNLFLCSSERQHQNVHASMEKCGFGMLGKNIWFSENNTYELFQCFREILPEIVIDQKQHVRKYGKLEYLFCRCPIMKRERPMHVLVCEKLIGRRLFRNEVVHHIDGDTLNNSVNNLQVMTISQHGKLHKILQGCVAELYRRGSVIFSDGVYS